MPFNINDFKSQGLIFGGARPSLFDVVLTLPDLVTDATDKLTFTCRASSIPAATISPIEVGYYGRKIKLAGDRTFADWSVTVMNDEDYSVRKMFEQWSNIINSHQNNVKTSQFNDYKSPDAEVYQYSKQGYPISVYKFVGIFPIEVSAMDLDWDATNTIQTFNVTFAYDYWQSQGLTTVVGPTSAAGNPDIL